MSETNETSDQDRYYLTVDDETKRVHLLDSLAEGLGVWPVKTYAGPDRLQLAVAALDRLNERDAAGVSVPPPSPLVEFGRALAELKRAAARVDRTAQELRAAETSRISTETAQDAPRVVQSGLWQFEAAAGLSAGSGHVGPTSPRPMKSDPGDPGLTPEQGGEILAGLKAEFPDRWA